MKRVTADYVKTARHRPRTVSPWLADALKLAPAHDFSPDPFAVPVPVLFALWQETERVVDVESAAMRAAVMECINTTINVGDHYSRISAQRERLQQAEFDREIARRQLLEPFIVE